MTYDNFKQSVLDAVRNHFSDSATVTITSVTKNNGQLYDALVIRETDCNISPSIYLNYYYNKTIENGEKAWTMDRVMESIFHTYSEIKVSKKVDLNFFINFENVKDNLFIKIINKELNKNLLTDVPYIEYLDLAIVFSYFVDENFCNGNLCQGAASILVHNNHMNLWNITKEELYKIALNNTPRIMGHCRFNMGDVIDLSSIIPSCCEPENNFQDVDIPFIVLTNKHQLFGAAVLCDIDELDSVATMLECNLVIIPSSIHEVIVFRTCDCPAPDELEAMINEVNRNDVSHEEILSNHPYFYIRDIKKVVC